MDRTSRIALDQGYAVCLAAVGTMLVAPGSVIEALRWLRSTARAVPA